MKIGYALALALSVSTPTLAQVIVTTPAQPPVVVDPNLARHDDNRAANIEERRAANQAAQGNYGNAARDAAAANADRAAGAAQ